LFGGCWGGSFVALTLPYLTYLLLALFFELKLGQQKTAQHRAMELLFWENMGNTGNHGINEFYFLSRTGRQNGGQDMEMGMG